MRQKTLSYLQHFLSVLLMCACVILGLGYSLQFGPDHNAGLLLTSCLYFVQTVSLLSIPFMVTNMLGLLTMNSFLKSTELQQPSDDIPFMLFRVVTRGMYPDLVRKNVDRNIHTCHKVGLSNFKFEVVTDKAVNFQKVDGVRELVVPADYVTRNRSMFKARALHYCTEPDISIYKLEDWIVHLDEETLLTESSVIGLANFASQKLADIGQGVISYANEDIVNWWTTLADSVRVSVDLGMMRFSLRKLGCPLMGFKGSYIIAKEKVEKDIGFDYGPTGSVAEDVVFALKAWSKGYTFGFVEGEMWEKSPFSVIDYIKQRKRWFIGHYFAILRKDIPLRYKLGIIPSDVNWFLLSFNLIANATLYVNNIQMCVFFKCLMGCMMGMILYLFMFGAIKSFSLRKYGWKVKMCLVILNVLFIPISACLDAIASLYGFFTRNHVEFYIVEKESNTTRLNTRNGISKAYNLDIV